MIGDNVHSGHRKRIVERFLKCGSEGFADYELLEMLLFATNRYCDTNPLSKSVLKTVRDFSGLLCATKEELLSINNIGTKSAELLFSLKTVDGLIRDAIGIKSENGKECIVKSEAFPIYFYDNDKIGSMLVSYFDKKTENELIAIAVDNEKKLFAYERLFESDFSSAAIRGERIIEFVKRSGASAVILAHNHPYGPSLPTDGDIATNGMVNRALESLGVLYLNHYVISGNSYYPVMYNKSNASYTVKEKGAGLEEITGFHSQGAVDLLYSVYSQFSKLDKDDLSSLYSECRGTQKFLSQKPEILMKRLGVSARDAVLINIMTEICLRSVISKFKAGKRYSDEGICALIRASFFGADAEYMGVVSFDSEHRYLGFDHSPRGIVNFVALSPQLVMEWVLSRAAKEIYVAHNHPDGEVNPSYLDLKTIEKLEKMFSATGILFTKAIITSGKSYKLINLKDYDLSKLR